MSQEARAREIIDEAVRRATEPLSERLEALEARLRAVEDGGGQASATEQKRPSAGRTARAKGSAGEPAGAGQ
ncbi:hypothetical protein ABTY20_22910 [Streptomyces sp. NPDC126497]|uniref:hypothetical protein n=1 Tax=Streptomyces sp. NPDC126497 TaxID=3155313 RepID=UPI00333007D6